MALLARFRTEKTPLLFLGSLLLLLLAALAVTLFSEQALKAQTARQAGAQGDLLASAVSGALAFDDRSAAQDYVDAVQVNPNVLAAAVYDRDNRLVASFSRVGEVIPPVAVQRGTTTTFQDGRLYVVRPVTESGQYLGTARLRLAEMTQAQRFGRYAGMLLVLGLGALVVIVLASAQSALRRANRELASRAEDLAAANAQLHEQMIEREKAEEALRQSQKMEAIGRLTGGIAHDFNNLLMIVSSAVDLQERTADAARRRKLSDGIRQAVERGAGLTRQLLAFSRRAPLKTTVIDPAAQLEAMRILLERSLREDIAVHLDFEPGVWPVEVDVGEFELALLNLAVNARDAMPEGGKLTITGSNTPSDTGEDDIVCIKVTDTGVGMSPTVAARVFEPFFTTKEVGRGTGLGLSQVYGFLRSSGGEVTVESQEGEGTTVILCLPRSEKPLTEAVETRKAAKGPKSHGRVLLVEDDDAVADGVGHMLRDLGYSYVRASDAQGALRALEQPEPFHLVFSDMVMPGEMNGLALAMAIRESRPGLPVLLTTGYSEAADAIAKEGFALLPKPYGIDDLSAGLAGLHAEAA